MPPKIVAPDIGLKSFSCPRCGALADQAWFCVYARATQNETPPFVCDEETLERVKNYKEVTPEIKKRQEEFVAEIERDKSGEIRFKEVKNEYCRRELINVHVSKCFSCSRLTLWRHKTVLYPATRYEVEPSPDLPKDISVDFEEARSILDLSPRGSAALLRLCIQKLCKHLGKPGKNINDDIATLVKDGLDSRVQKALDIVRVVGNEAVHPGTMDLKDDRSTATKLFDLSKSVMASLTSKSSNRAPPHNVIPLESGIHAVSALPPKADIL